MGGAVSFFACHKLKAQMLIWSFMPVTQMEQSINALLLKAKEAFWQLSHWYFRHNQPHSFLMLHMTKMFSIIRPYHFFITLNTSVLFSMYHMHLSQGVNSSVNSVTSDHILDKYFESIIEIPNNINNPERNLMPQLLFLPHFCVSQGLIFTSKPMEILCHQA